ncbi:MAG: efflux RND transporter periplasmic adaptor subunit [Planctomycetota bacterium]|nr:efflux RND transporter periplasmic adaptor subunit [Planctomycetota bacterium]
MPVHPLNPVLSNRPSIGLLLACIAIGVPVAAQTTRKVQVYVAKPQAMDVRSPLQGEILPLSRMDLVPRVTGYVKTIHVAEGARVEQGKQLITMDCPDREQDKAVAEAGVVQARSVLAVAGSAVNAAERAVEVAQADHQQSITELEVARSSLKQAESSYQRIKKLYGEGAATVDEFETAELLYLKTRSRIDTAKSAIVAANARVSAAQTQVELRKSEAAKAKAGVTVAVAESARAALFVELAAMKNPYAIARVTRQIVDVGNLAIADQTAVLELMDISKVRIRFTVPRAEASRVAAGSAVRLLLPRSIEPYDAKVTRVAGVLTPLSRTMACEVELDNRDGRWIPGNLVKVDLLVETLQDALLIPGRGIVKVKDSAFAWLAYQGKAKKDAVRVGFHRGRLVQVIDGLKSGDQVLVAGFTGLAEGDPIETTVVER